MNIIRSLFDEKTYKLNAWYIYKLGAISSLQCRYLREHFWLHLVFKTVAEMNNEYRSTLGQNRRLYVVMQGQWIPFDRWQWKLLGVLTLAT